MRIGVVQFPLQEKQSEQRYTQKILEFCQQARDQKLDLIVFPELAPMDMADFQKELMPQWRELDRVSSKVQQQLENFSRENRVAVLTPSTPHFVRDKVVNTCAFIVEGKVQQVIQKHYLTPSEKSYGFSPGTSRKVFKAMGIRIAVLICYDSEFPNLSNELAASDLDLMLIPTMTDDLQGSQRVLSCALTRCIEHQCFVALSAIVPTAQTASDYFGMGAIFSPRTPYFGPSHLEGQSNSPAVVVADLDFQKLALSKADPNTIYPARDLRA